MCPQCHNLRSICEDPASVWNPQITTCYASLATASHQTKYQRHYEKRKPDADGWHPTQGVQVWVTPDLPPDPWFGLARAPESD